MGDTSIGWTHRPGTRARTWNPTQGCALKSEGCRNCYAMRQARRFAGPGKPFDGLINLKTGKWTGAARLAAHKLTEPLSWRAPSTVFVDSMSDLFYEGFTNEEIAAVFGVMAACPQHTFQILTKRPDRMREWFAWLEDQGHVIHGHFHDEYDGNALACWDHAKAAIKTTGAAIESSDWDTEMMGRGHLIQWPLPNVWLGVSVENQAAADERIPELLQTPAAIHFLSCEPLLGPLDLSRWIGGINVRKDQEGRGIRLPRRGGRRVGDRPAVSDLASRDSTWNENWGDTDRPGPSAASGSARERGVLECASDGRRETNDSACAPIDLATRQRSDTGRDDDQPQEREQVGQPDRESRDRDGQRANDPRDSGAQDQQGGASGWSPKSKREADGDAGLGDPGRPLGGRSPTDARSEVRRDLSAHLEDRSRRYSIRWLICGCESGPGARECDIDWLRELRDQCERYNVSFFLKQAVEDLSLGFLPLGYSQPLPNIAFSHGSNRKGKVIEAPYLDGKQHLEFPA